MVKYKDIRLYLLLYILIDHEERGQCPWAKHNGDMKRTWGGNKENMVKPSPLHEMLTDITW